eukprot:TRINITY_DN6946_c1_g1_i1.p1 TRINITY_DN6946_c1_g1~~TRINITY_DN6946_c1_g1_i1.p1  ORF type:complete len:146 (-),score=8.88 TRINITY_DN6946_c1_g1_i1:24-461(-)
MKKRKVDQWNADERARSEGSNAYTEVSMEETVNTASHETSSKESSVSVGALRSGPLSIRDDKTLKWIGYQFRLNLTELYSKDREIVIDLKSILSIRKSRGLWPGFELELLDSKTKSMSVMKFHAEGDDDINDWICDLQGLCISSQ